MQVSLDPVQGRPEACFDHALELLVQQQQPLEYKRSRDKLGKCLGRTLITL
jgi:hypothetical protein